MSAKSGVYLVSAKPSEGNVYDNPSFQSPDTKVTYSTTNGVDVLEEKRAVPVKPYRGMGKEDLLHFSSQPFWKRMRMACVGIIVLGWIALIITVVALVMAYPKCRDPGSRSWWQTEAMYRIYVPSFKDSDGDGIGDLKGVESKLSYIQDLGENVISLSPFYKTNTGATFAEGNDMAITDHKDVGPEYGTLQDFSDLVTAAHDKGMYVVVDFIPGLTSDQHPWFVNSSTGVRAQKNFYVWTNSTNNWKSIYDGTAWTANATRAESYLHQFDSSTPDLNLRSAQVQQELESILTFWLDQGVDGFNVRDAAYLYEDFDMRDEPLKAGAPTGSNNYTDYDHIYTSNQPEVYGILARWRTLLRSYNKTTTDKLLMTGLDGGLDAEELYGDCDRSGVQMPLNTGAATLGMSCDGACIRSYVDDWMSQLTSGRWANWVTGDDTMPRMASRFNRSFIQPFTMLTMLLPGTPVLYYGDEIYMQDARPGTGNQWARQQPMRTLMQWENATNAGFCNSTCNPWTGVGDTSNSNADSGSGLTSLIKELAALRSEPSFHVGDYVNAIRDGSVFSFVREFDGETGYLVAINFGPNSESRDFSSSHSTVQSEVIVTYSLRSDYAADDEVESDGLTLGPYGGLVVSWDYMAKEL